MRMIPVLRYSTSFVTVPVMPVPPAVSVVWVVTMGTSLPTLMVCESAAWRVKVALAGDGGDELLALLRKFRVSAYLVGHRHRASRYLLLDGTAHVHCEDLAWGERGAYHVYHVFPDRLVCCWKPVRLRQPQPHYERIEFPTPRALR